MKSGEALANINAWKVIATEAFKALQFEICKNCFAKCFNYGAIQYVNRVSALDV
jgi:hypothetical protein